MIDFMKNIERKFKIYKTKGASDELIKEAERMLGLNFSNDYREYLSEYGSLSFDNTELTGLNIDNYANVVTVTLRERQMNNLFPKDSYVIENAGVEGLLVLQNKDGEVYEWINGKIGHRFKNLNSYLESKLNSEENQTVT